ncbi:MAG: nucleotidyltransferase domain-containing protein [Defluviitaleaceae bacterium]|nr:nucleotidyltransferase domain-containing protein [Defluviitaleaceae bacterium]
MQDFGLKAEVLGAIVAVLKCNPKIEKAVIFGSRAKGNFRNYSDIDIAIYGEVDSTDAEHIICELDELPTAHSFDVTAFDAIKNPALQEHIKRVGVLIYRKETV